MLLAELTGVGERLVSPGLAVAPRLLGALLADLLDVVAAARPGSGAGFLGRDLRWQVLVGIDAGGLAGAGASPSSSRWPRATHVRAGRRFSRVTRARISLSSLRTSPAADPRRPGPRRAARRGPPGSCRGAARGRAGSARGGGARSLRSSAATMSTMSDASSSITSIPPRKSRITRSLWGRNQSVSQRSPTSSRRAFAAPPLRVTRQRAWRSGTTPSIRGRSGWRFSRTKGSPPCQ